MYICVAFGYELSELRPGHRMRYSSQIYLKLIVCARRSSAEDNDVNVLFVDGSISGNPDTLKAL